MATRIVFDKEHALVVEEDLDKVTDKLSTSPGWPEFNSATRGPVTVNAAQIVYVQEAVSGKMHAL